MKPNLCLFLIVTITILLGTSSCTNKDKKHSAKVQHKETTNQAWINEPDSIIVTVSIQGRRDRLSMLQQKTMFKAKKKLADTLMALNNMIDSVNNEGATFKEIALKDITVIHESLVVPDKRNPNEVIAMMTVGVKNPNKSN